MMKNRILKKGFTLLEILIVIIIIGVLAALALPRLYAMVERSRATEALVGFSVIRSAMERCFLMNNGTYNGCCLNNTTDESCSGPDSINTLGIEDPGQSPNAHFSYWVHEQTDIRYHISALRLENDGIAPGKYSQCQREIFFIQDGSPSIYIRPCNDPDHLYRGMVFGDPPN